MRSLSILFLLFLTFHANAQRHINRQRALCPIVGFTDHIDLNKFPAPNSGYFGSVTYSRYTKNENNWQVLALYSRKYYPKIDDQPVKLEHYLLGFNYVPRLIYSRKRDFYLSPVFGIVSGYELINRNDLHFTSGEITNKSSWVIGPTLGIDAEYYLSEQIALVGIYHARILAMSKSNSLVRFQSGIGIRFSFFKQ